MDTRLAYSTQSTGATVDRQRFATGSAVRAESILQAAFARGLTDDELRQLARRYGFRLV